MRVCLTVDTEPDCPPFLTTYRGIEEGLPALLNLFSEEQVSATFFTTGDVARRYPQAVRQIVSAGHELGCHGDTHRRFDQMDDLSAVEEIRNATETLRRFYPVVSFRAPNLAFPERHLPLLEGQGYRLDSSQAKYKRNAGNGFSSMTLSRIPASVTSSVLRLPKAIRYPWFRLLSDPVVLFVHPWEFVDFRNSSLRLDCRFRTGATALQCLRENIRFFKSRKARFLPMKDLAQVPPRP
jgi:peptidoglycan-N-acetylglucosamine deacetylase